MKKTFLISIIFMMSFVLQGNATVIYVQDDVSGIWNADTVIVSSEIQIPSDSTLIIEPGTIVLFWSYCKFIVNENATLKAIGNETDSILFDEYFEGNHWQGIRFLGASDSSRLEYCHITNGVAMGDGEDIYGGGIYMHSSSPLISHCLIDSCSAWNDGRGGGLYLTYSSNPIVDSCSIIGNSATKGGGIGCWENSAPSLTDNTIFGNWSDKFAGGIACVYSSPYIFNNTINENSCDSGSGGGIFCSNASPDIISNTISYNKAAERGGGIKCDYSDPTIEDNTITYDTAGSRSGGYGIGGGIYCFESNPVINNNVIDNNTATRDGRATTAAVYSYGGGIYCENSSPDITNNSIKSNSAYTHGYGNSYAAGGGIMCSVGSDPYIYNNAIDSNTVYARSDNLYYETRGGGICCYSSSPTIEECNIRNNVTSGSQWNIDFGGGIFCSNSSPDIIKCVIQGNFAFFVGGGIFVTNSSPQISDCIIRDNSSKIGGGIHCGINSNPLIRSNRITGNEVDENGGGVWSSSVIDTFEYNEISGNVASGNGGGVYLIDCDFTLRNNTIVDNIADSGGGIFCYNSNPYILNSILWGNFPQQMVQTEASSLQIDYSDIEGVWPGGTGNIHEDPLFINPLAGNYLLSWTHYPVSDETKSPCIDAGDPQTQYNDQDGSRADIGAYHYGFITGVDEHDNGVYALPDKCNLGQNFPNPFNPITTIDYNVPSRSQVTIEVFNVLGQKVKTLLDEQKSAGLYRVTWNGTDENGEAVGTGIYLYRIQSANLVETRKMLLLK